MIVFPLIPPVRLKAATASSRAATLPMFVRNRCDQSAIEVLHFGAASVKHFHCGPGGYDGDQKRIQKPQPFPHNMAGKMERGHSYVMHRTNAGPTSKAPTALTVSELRKRFRATRCRARQDAHIATKTDRIVLLTE